MKSEDKTVNYYSINVVYVILFIVTCLLGAWVYNAICPPQYVYYLGIFVGVFSFSFFEKIVNPMTKEDFETLSKEEDE